MLPRSARRFVHVILAIVLFCSVVPCVLAEPVGSPASILKKKQWIFGLSGGGIFGRGMQGGSDINIYSIGHYRGYGLTDRISAYLKLGVGWMSAADAISNLDQSMGANVMASAQLKTRLWQDKRQKWEWDGSLQYTYIHARHRDNNEGLWKEWQGSTTVARTMGRFTPYLGMKVSLADLQYTYRKGGRITQQGKYKGENYVGPIFGTDIRIGQGEQVTFNVETAYVNGPELDLAVAYTF